MDKETTGLLRLTLSGVDPSDVGTYKCRIYNPHGEDFCTANLTYDSKYHIVLLLFLVTNRPFMKLTGAFL